MRSAFRPCPRLLPLALTAAGALAAPAAGAAPPVSSTLSAAPSAPPPPPLAPTPRAAADGKRMFAVTFTNMVVWENGSGYIHAFWRTLGSSGPDSPALLQWGRGCPDISDRTFTALLTAFSTPGAFFLIVDKSPDARQPGAYCVTHVEVERINPIQEPPVRPAPTSPATPPPVLAPNPPAKK
jgi:hypothetical protein